MRSRHAIAVLIALVLCGSSAGAKVTISKPPDAPTAPSKFRSAEDGWLDASAFLDETYGFLPLAIPITEPAVGCGAAGGLAFISKPLAEAQAGFGRPNITIVGGLGTENGTWGAAVGDVRHWFDDRVETQAGLVYASANLDFYGVGEDRALGKNPLRYNLEPKGGCCGPNTGSASRARGRASDTPSRRRASRSTHPLGHLGSPTSSAIRTWAG